MFNVIYEKRSDLKIWGGVGLLKCIIIFIITISHVLFSHKIDKSISSADKSLTRKVIIALKKRIGSKYIYD